MPQIRPSINLNALPLAIPCAMYSPPREGLQSVPYTLNWSVALIGNVDTFSINMQDNSYLEFSQICGLMVDNSNCGADIDFIFPDTDVVISIPAYAPYTVLQVNTRAKAFYVRALGALAIDQTSFSVLNFAPAPVAVPITKQQQIARISNATLDGVTTVALIAADVSGSLQNFQFSFAFPKPSVSFNNRVDLVDGAGATLWSGNIAAQDTSSGQTAMLANLNGISIRFENGLSIHQQGGFTPGATFNASAHYITP